MEDEDVGMEGGAVYHMREQSDELGNHSLVSDDSPASCDPTYSAMRASTMEQVKETRKKAKEAEEALQLKSDELDRIEVQLCLETTRTGLLQRKKTCRGKPELEGSVVALRQPGAGAAGAAGGIAPMARARGEAEDDPGCLDAGAGGRPCQEQQTDRRREQTPRAGHAQGELAYEIAQGHRAGEGQVGEVSGVDREDGRGQVQAGTRAQHAEKAARTGAETCFLPFILILPCRLQGHGEGARTDHCVAHQHVDISCSEKFRSSGAAEPGDALASSSPPPLNPAIPPLSASSPPPTPFPLLSSSSICRSPFFLLIAPQRRRLERANLQLADRLKDTENKARAAGNLRTNH
eukprot:752305-Hanusia_phi.AAC.4